MSGSIPFAWIERPDGVKYRAVVSRGAPSKRDDGLHRALAEGARADERGALVVLQRPGDDFRRRRRTAVDQQDVSRRRRYRGGCDRAEAPREDADNIVVAQYLACALPCERFTSALADNPCITRGQCGSLLLHCDGLPPSAFCRSPGAPVHSISSGLMQCGKLRLHLITSSARAGRFGVSRGVTV